MNPIGRAVLITTIGQLFFVMIPVVWIFKLVDMGLDGRALSKKDWLFMGITCGLCLIGLLLGLRAYLRERKLSNSRNPGSAGARLATVYWIIGAIFGSVIGFAVYLS